VIIKGKTLPEQDGRKPYPLTSGDVVGKHFVVRVTTPDNPFEPHQHAQREIWFIVQGEALVSLHGEEHAVEAGDLVELEPWVEHGLRTESRVTWICLG
jgi:mannose-6-phosphate isomerase-like protein (cupin superfamily)